MATVRFVLAVFKPGVGAERFERAVDCVIA
ncbi:hypothetical protein ABIB80_005013 [Bradyrhizobium sp. i1.15.2]